MAETKTTTAAASEPKAAPKKAAKPATKAAAKVKMIRIQYYRSKNSTPAKHKAVVKGLGFTRAQPDRRARRYRIHPRHGQSRSAPGQDSSKTNRAGGPKAASS